MSAQPHKRDALLACSLKELDLYSSVASLIPRNSSPVGGFLGFPVGRDCPGFGSVSAAVPVHSSSSFPSSSLLSESSASISSSDTCTSGGPSVSKAMPSSLMYCSSSSFSSGETCRRWHNTSECAMAMSRMCAPSCRLSSPPGRVFVYGPPPWSRSGSRTKIIDRRPWRPPPKNGKRRYRSDRGRLGLRALIYRHLNVRGGDGPSRGSTPTASGYCVALGNNIGVQPPVDDGKDSSHP